MEVAKRRMCGVALAFIVLGAVVFVPRLVLAVPGQLNNGFATPTPQVIIITPDTTALENCNQKYSQAQEDLRNCQKAAVVTTKIDSEGDVEEHAYLIWAIVSTVIAFIFGGILLTGFIKKRKTPPSTPVVPPFHS